MEFTDVLKQIIESYGGVGIFIVFLLIICIVSIPVGLPIFLNKKLEKNGKEITKGVTDGMNVIANTLTENMSSQNEILINTLKESQSKLLDTQTNMIGYIMSSVNTIVNNENIKNKEIHNKGISQRAEIDLQINQILHDMLLSYMADRTIVMEFHNSNTNIGGLPFLWYDIHYEQIAKDVPILFTKVQNIPSSNIAPVIKDLQDGTDNMVIYMPEDIEKLKEQSTVLYYQLKEIDIQYLIYAPIYDSNNIMVGLCVIEYSRYFHGDNLFKEFILRKTNEIHNNVARIAGLLDFKHKIEKTSN